MKIEWNLWVNEYGGISIKGEAGLEPVIEVRAGELSATEHAALNFVVEIARCLLIGKSIDHTFNPTKTLERIQEEEQLVRCRWLKSGKLIMMNECSKRWKHAATIEEAISRQRVFTCTRNVYDSMPKRRPRKLAIVPVREVSAREVKEMPSA